MTYQEYWLRIIKSWRGFSVVDSDNIVLRTLPTWKEANLWLIACNLVIRSGPRRVFLDD